MNLPNALNLQHYQPNRNDSIDFGFLSTHFNENAKDKVESLFQLDKSEKFPSSTSDNNHKIRQNNLCHFGYDKCFDTNSIEYRANNLNFSYENLFETNTMADQSCTQPIAYNTNYGEVNQLSNETGKFSIYYSQNLNK